jgi:hypothetical protein
LPNGSVRPAIVMVVSGSALVVHGVFDAVTSPRIAKSRAGSSESRSVAFPAAIDHVVPSCEMDASPLVTIGAAEAGQAMAAMSSRTAKSTQVWRRMQSSKALHTLDHPASQRFNSPGPSATALFTLRNLSMSGR